MDAERILVATSRGSSLPSNRRGAAEPARAAIVKHHVVEAERRRRAKARSNFDMIISYDQQRRPSSLRPPRATLGT